MRSPMIILYFLLLGGMTISSATSQQGARLSTEVQPHKADVADCSVSDRPELAMSPFVADAISG